MTQLLDQLDTVTRYVTPERLIDILSDLINIPSPTGSELAIGDYLLDHFARLGMRTKRQEIEDGRLNAIGIYTGSGDGPTLMFNGHLDTSLTGQDEHDRSVLGEVHDGFRPRAYLEDGYVRGLGAFNMKGPVACYLAAVEALTRGGIQLKGDVIVAGVAGEIEKTPVDTLTPGYSGRLYRGAGCGTRYLAPHGVWADYAIVGEPSALHINTAHPGYCWFKITVRGHFTRTTAIDRGVNAVRKMGRVMEAVHEWGRQYTLRKTAEWEESVGHDDYCVIKPNVNIGAIEGGWPYKPTWSTAICNLFIDVRTLPGDSPLDVQRELQGVLDSLKASDGNLVVSQDMYMSNPGGRLTDRASYIVTAAENAIERVIGRKPGRVPYAFGSYWCDMNILNRMGIESITLGPGNEDVARWDGKGEYISVDELLKGTRAYLAIILDVCGQEREAVRGKRYR